MASLEVIWERENVSKQQCCGCILFSAHFPVQYSFLKQNSVALAYFRESLGAIQRNSLVDNVKSLQKIAWFRLRQSFPLHFSFELFAAQCFGSGSIQFSADFHFSFGKGIFGHFPVCQN